MSLRRSQLLIVTALIITASATAFAQNATPKGVVAAFYNYDATHSQVFDRPGIDAHKRWFSAELYKLLLNELDREKAFLAQNPSDKPHFGDGLPFRPLDEACGLNGREYRRTISFGRVSIKGDLANVDVYFKYPKGCDIPDVLYAVNMSKERGRWVIDDIRYIAENASLVEDLGRKEY